jgi:hypothetical protein
MRWIAGMLLVALVGCHEVTPQEQTAEACDMLCDCVGGTLPSEHATCVQQCTSSLGMVSDVCFTCVVDHQDACPLLLTKCEAACTTSQPMPRGGM